MMFRKGAPDSVVDLFSYAVAVRDGRWSCTIRNREIAFKQFLLVLKKSDHVLLGMWKTVGEKLSLLLLPRSQVICCRKVPSEEQIKDLLRKKNFKEAISLVEFECKETMQPSEVFPFIMRNPHCWSLLVN